MLGLLLHDPEIYRKKLIEYKTDAAELIIVSMGTIAETVKVVVDNARSRGIRVGAARVVMFRPFPDSLLSEVLSRASRIAVIDRNISLGFGGVLWGEVRGLAAGGTIVQNYLAGLGGGDVRPEHIEEMVTEISARERAGEPVFIGVGE